MCSANPYYEENLQTFSRWFASLDLATNSVVCEVGAGTGNFLLQAIKQKPELRYVHIDLNVEMNRIAEEKYASCGHQVEVLQSDATQLDREASFDVVIAVNTLYTMSDYSKALDAIFLALKPDGYFFCIDLGRELDTSSWVRELVKYNIRQRGGWNTAKLVYSLLEVINQNRKIDRAQASGAFRGHSSDSFREMFEAAGFHVIRQGVCYRDKCDLLIARRPAGVLVDPIIQRDALVNGLDADLREPSPKAAAKYRA